MDVQQVTVGGVGSGSWASWIVWGWSEGLARWIAISELLIAKYLSLSQAGQREYYFVTVP